MRAGQQSRPVGGKGGLSSQAVSKTCVDNVDNTGKSNRGGAVVGDKGGGEGGLPARESEDLPSGLTMKIRIEKHYNSGTGDKKKVAFVVASTSASSDHTEEELVQSPQDGKVMEDGDLQKSMLQQSQSLDGPNTAVLNLNTHQIESGNTISRHHLFCLPVPTLVVPPVYSDGSPPAAPAVASLALNVTTAAPQAADFALHLAHYRLSTEQYQELQQNSSNSASSSSPVVTPVPILTVGDRHQALSSSGLVQGGLVSSAVPTTGVPSAPNSPAVTTSPAGMAPGGVSPQLNSHLPLPLTASSHLIPQQRVLSLDNNGLDANQLKQALVG